MLVVIGIIAILVGILFPVFNRARIKARQVKCTSNLQQIVVGLKLYYQDYQAYPQWPTWSPNAGPKGRFTGGVSALYPDYISDLGLLICPDDETALMKIKDAKDIVYSSYNSSMEFRDFLASTNRVTGFCDSGVDANGAAVTFLKNRLYNYFGYADGVPAGDPYPMGYDPYQLTGTSSIYIGPENGSAIPWWLSEAGLSWRYYPRLMNKYAPDNTIVVHCMKHRRYYNQKDWKDIVARLGGTVATVETSAMAATISPSGGGTAVSGWIHQRY
jgi:type II secretory pathway pseudopilin PulG